MGPVLKLLLAAVLLLWPGHGLAQKRLVVFAPASMGDVMGHLADAFVAQGGTRPVFSVAGTAQLARQVVAGAPADIFISADERWMDHVVEKGAVESAVVVPFAGNGLVLAVRTDVGSETEPETLLTKSRFAMGAPDSVPAGTYGRAALQARGWWELAKPQAVYSENVRLALKWLARGEVGAALVYATDVAAEPMVKSAFTFAQGDHPPIRYFAAPIGQPSAKAEVFLNFLASPAAQDALKRAGFNIIGEMPGGHDGG
ncbi:MAG: molybdate ABC transporter substrate-binding protein [Pseudomonadota bacterium]